MDKAIRIPERSRQNLAELSRQSQTIKAQFDAIIITLRDALSVPDDHILADIEIGFVPPRQPDDQAPAP